MAGLLTARVLSEHFDTVTVYERDALADHPAPRPGVPQSKHAHGLVARGHEVIESLFPDIGEDLAQMGVVAGDFNLDIDWFFGGKKLSAARSGLVSIPATRPTLEFAIRRHVTQRANVELRDRTEVSGLSVHGDTVLGLELYDSDRASCHSVDTDLVVDCSGRTGLLARWMDARGMTAPREEEVGIGLAYTSARFRVRSDPFGDKIATILANSPEAPRGCFFYRSPGDDNVVEISLTGMLGDHAPINLPGFMDFVRSLPVPSVHEALKDAELVSGPVKLTYPASRWRHYEESDHLLKALVPLGDAICSLNPIYAQGMTVAALQVLALQSHLERAQFNVDAYLNECASIVAQAWAVSAGADLAYSGTTGRRTLQTRLVNRYVSRLQRGATRDPKLSNAFFEVAGLMRPPTSLMRPAIVARVLRSNLTRTTSTTSTVSKAGECHA